MRSGFSLVELSIVLVILGLLTGGILAGQSLIRASELRSVSSDIQRYTTAVHTFRDKYFALPGDMTNATKFWTAQDPTPATCQTTTSTTQATCDGNGSGIVGNTIPEYYEMFRAWQHLANAALVEGTYSGVAGAGGNQHGVIGTNIPRMKITNAGISFYGLGTSAGSAALFAGNYGTAFIIGAQHATGVPYSVLLKAEELWNIDTKMDDGRPAYGNIVGYPNSARPNCTSSDTPSSADYVLTSTVIGCTMLVKTGF